MEKKNKRDTACRDYGGITLCGPTGLDNEVGMRLRVLIFFFLPFYLFCYICFAPNMNDEDFSPFMRAVYDSGNFNADNNVFGGRFAAVVWTSCFAIRGWSCLLVIAAALYLLAFCETSITSPGTSLSREKSYATTTYAIICRKMTAEGILLGHLRNSAWCAQKISMRKTSKLMQGVPLTKTSPRQRCGHRGR